jgi:hypothetical protein
LLKYLSDHPAPETAEDFRRLAIQAELAGETFRDVAKSIP